MNLESVQKNIWDASNKLRGTIDAANYKDYLLTLLFWKYISDISINLENAPEWSKLNKSQKAKVFGNNPKYLEKKLRLDHLNAKKNQDDIASLLNNAKDEIENKHLLYKGTFQDVDFNSSKLGNSEEKNFLIRELLTIFNSKDLDFTKPASRDVIGEVYQYLLGQFASSAGKKGGEFYTPANVSKLVALLAKPKRGNSIYDPTVGSGSLLLKAAEVAGNKNLSLYGQEKNNQTIPLAKMNMIIHDFQSAKIANGDTLTNPQFTTSDNEIEKFDIVVANPPFSAHIDIETLKADPFQRFQYGLPGKNQGDWAFVQHMIASLKSKGRLSVVLPIGPLFRSNAEAKIRKQIIKAKLVESVVLLPDSLFYGTTISACVLTFSKNNNEKIKFVDGSSFFKKEKNNNLLEDKDIDKILSLLTKDELNFSKTVNITDLEEYSLNVTTYTKEEEIEEVVDLNKLQQQIINLKD